MPSRHKLYMQIRMLFGRSRAGQRLQDELRFHLDSADKRKHGLRYEPG